MRLRLGPLSADETEAYITHAFKAAGMQNLLSPTAVGCVQAASGGSPRHIGAILSRALWRALSKQSRLLSDEIIQEVLDGEGS